MHSKLLGIVFLLVSGVADRGELCAGECGMKFRGGFIWIDVTSPQFDRPAQFLLDSGAEKTVIDLKAAKNWGVALTSRIPIQGVGGMETGFQGSRVNISLAGVTHRMNPVVLDLSGISRRCGRRIDGLLGADFFHGRTIQIDYRNRKIRCFDSGFKPSPRAQGLPIKRNYGALCVAVNVDGVSLPRVRIDTGCDGTLHWSKAGSSLESRSRGQVSVGLFQGKSTACTCRIRLGHLELPRQRTVQYGRQIFQGENGLLGNGLLKQFLVTVDSRRQTLFLEPN